MKKEKKPLNLPRVPLPRQTGGAHKADKGGKYNRNQTRREARHEIKEVKEP